MYITFDEYAELYEHMDEKLFNRLNMEATRVVDRYTTGIDNVKKLKVAFPTVAEDAAAVKFCIAKIIAFLHRVQAAEAAAQQSRGYESTESGIRGRVVTSVTAGNESISYGTATAADGADAAAKDPAAKEKMLADMIRQDLSGIADANGVSLLYAGVYPSV